MTRLVRDVWAPAIPWEERPAGSNDVLWRATRNPIVARDQIPRANSIFNSAVVPFGDGFAGVFRVDDTSRLMNLHAGRSDDGIDWQIDVDPIVFEPNDDRVAEAQTAFEHAYDPRVTWLDDRYYVTWCTGYHGPTIGVAFTHDFRTFHSTTTPFCPSTATACSFRAGSVTATRCSAARATGDTRPSATSSTPRARISCTGAAIDTCWGRSPFSWQSTKVGAGPTPIETDEGWLLVYHGVLTSCNGFVYSMGAALLDLDEPWNVIARGSDYLLSPQALYEQVGDVPNVVFPCAALVDHAADRLTIYYGAADTVVCLAHGHLSQVLDFVRS